MKGIGEVQSQGQRDLLVPENNRGEDKGPEERMICAMKEFIRWTPRSSEADGGSRRTAPSSSKGRMSAQ